MRYALLSVCLILIASCSFRSPNKNQVKTLKSTLENKELASQIIEHNDKSASLAKQIQENSVKIERINDGESYIPWYWKYGAIALVIFILIGYIGSPFINSIMVTKKLIKTFEVKGG
jgi:uncharacterized membrane-anchored protein YhcB (DUF1043 family)